MKEQMQLELKMWFAMTVKYLWFALFGKWMPNAIYRSLQGWEKLKNHIQTEREKMTANNYALWRQILRRDNWTCKKCHTQNWQNIARDIPKMEVDHCKSLYHYGYSIPSNLQVLCKPCNQAKGVKDAFY